VSRRNVVQEMLERFGREAALEKKSGVWYRRGDGVIGVVDLQKSQYGPKYYLNVGFWLEQLGEERYPKPERSHISVRLETLVPEERERIAKLLDLDDPIGDEERVEELLSVLKGQVLPLLERGSSAAQLQALVKDGTLKGAAIRRPAQELLATSPG
jgi:hypothetical protein